MKVITQLIRHFWQRSALTPEEIGYLIDHGFVRAKDLPGYQAGEETAADDWVEPEPVEPPDQMEVIQDQLARRGRGRKSATSRGAVLEVNDICNRIDRELARRQEDLESLVALAPRVEPCESWKDAVVMLRQVPEKRFQRIVRGALRNNAITLRHLWRAVDMEPFYRLVPGEEGRGRAVNAYWSLLVAPDTGSLGKYGWILHHESMQIVNNLRTAHLRVVNALHRLYLTDRALLTHALPACDPIPFWSLLLLYNAQRLSNPRVGQVRDYEIPQPKSDVWQQAWTMALGMDRAPVTNLLIACYRDTVDRDQRAPDLNEQRLYCPVGWHEPD